MKEFIKKHKVEFIFFLIAFSCTVLPTIILSNDGLFLTINRHHSALFNSVMPYFTGLVETWGIVVFAILMLVINYRLFYAALFSMIVSSGIAQIIKHTFPGANERPAEHFKDIVALNFVPNVELNYFYSFPSGHTTASFTLFTLFALYFDNKYLKALMLFMAFVVGFSRVYLAQHFPVDVIGGELIGFSFACIFYYVFFYRFPRKK